MTDFSIYLTYIGNDNYQMFVKNNGSETDFIRIIIGYTEMISGKRVGGATDSWIISPLQPESRKVFIQQINKRMLYGKRIWIAFEAVKRNKPKNTILARFIALSPTPSKWRETIGSCTSLELKRMDTIKQLFEESVTRMQLSTIK